MTSKKDDLLKRLIHDILVYNFEPEDIVEHGPEILHQIWYEASINNTNIIPITE